MKTLAIIGSGDLGRQIAHYATGDGHYGDVVYFDDFTTAQMAGSFKILGKTSEIEKAYADKKFDELLIGIGYMHLPVRKEMYERFSGSIPFGKVVHSSTWTDATAEIAPGCVIYPCCQIDAGVSIAANSVLNIGCTVAHDTIIGSHTFLSPRVAVAGFVTIGEQCIIGINSTIIDNISIADKTQLGGAAVVIKNIEKPGLYVGNPHKFVR